MGEEKIKFVEREIESDDWRKVKRGDRGERGTFEFKAKQKKHFFTAR